MIFNSILILWIQIHNTYACKSTTYKMKITLNGNTKIKLVNTKYKYQLHIQKISSIINTNSSIIIIFVSLVYKYLPHEYRKNVRAFKYGHLSFVFPSSLTPVYLFNSFFGRLLPSLAWNILSVRDKVLA